MKERLDIFLAKNGFVETRNKSSELIKDGKVYVNGNKVVKPSYLVNENDEIKIDENSDVLKYVSRGGLKLEKAINSFGYDMNGKTLIDIGSSTGGFTDCALKHGASLVISVDVGTNQMHKSLIGNEKIKLYENTDIRNLDKSIVKDVTVAVMDISFISVTKIVEYIKEYPRLEDIICLIKPQFECGREVASKYKGIILNKNIHEEIIKSVVLSFKQNGFYLNGLTPSSIRGGDGNIEHLALFSKNPKNIDINFVKVVCEAFKN